MNKNTTTIAAPETISAITAPETPRSDKHGHMIEQPHTTPPVLLNYQTLWTFYGLYKNTVAKLVMNGKFCNIVKVGNKNHFKRDDVEAWIDAQTFKVA